MILEKLSKDTQNLARVKQAGIGDFLGQIVGGGQRFYEDAKEDLGKAKDRAGAWAEDKLNKGRAWADDKLRKGKAWAGEKYDQGIEGINAGLDRMGNAIDKEITDFSNAEMRSSMPYELRTLDPVAAEQETAQRIKKLLGEQGMQENLIGPMRNSPEFLANLRRAMGDQAGDFGSLIGDAAAESGAGFTDLAGDIASLGGRGYASLEDMIRGVGRSAGGAMDSANRGFARARKENEISNLQHEADLANLSASDSAVIEDLLGRAGSSIQDFASSAADKSKDVMGKIMQNLQNADPQTRGALAGSAGITALLTLMKIMKDRNLAKAIA